MAAQATAGIIVTHGQDLIQTGVETLRTAASVLAGARRELHVVAVRTRGELRTTFLDGQLQLKHKLSHLAVPTRKEQAAAHKADVKAKKLRKRSEKAHENTDGPADGQAADADPAAAH